MPLQIRRLSYALGAEITGVDCREPIDERTASEIRAAFLEHCVLLFRAQPLTHQQHVAFSRIFGELDKNEIAPHDRDSEYPEIEFNTNQPKPGGLLPTDGALTWHSDRPFSLSPAMATVLHGVEVPNLGGDTMFANMYLAYESLSDGMKQLLDGVYGVHPGPKRIIDTSTPEREAETKRLSRPVAQPLVRVHPETGRKALFIGPKVKQLVGFTTEESAPLIQFLCDHATRSQYVFRHQWLKDDLLVWDNRCTLHRGVGDYDRKQLRCLEKTCVLGTPSGGFVYEGH